MKKKCLSIIIIASALIANAQPIPVSIFPSPVVPNYPLSTSSYYTDFNGVLFFRADDFNLYPKWELWKTNGYLNGTVKIASLLDGPAGCGSGKLVATKNKVFFRASDTIVGSELWVSDGSTAGTVLLKDINPGSGSSCIESLTAMGDTLFFAANDGVHGYELWMSDGTSAGTKMVKDIHTTPVSADGLNPLYPLTVINGILYFAANNFLNGTELWRSDGSTAGTYMVKDINPGSASSNGGAGPIVKVGSNFYFGAGDATNGGELYKSDGTQGGTYLVKDINPGSASSQITFINNIGDSLAYFSANDGLYGAEFWRSNGTASGTYMLKDFNIGSGNGWPTYFMPLFKVNNEYYMPANVSSAFGMELYKTNAFLNTFTLVKDINPGAASSGLVSFSNWFTLLGNIFYFPADDGTHGTELWMSDGTTVGTNLVKDMYQGPSSASPQWFTISNNKLFFNLTVGSLWKLDTCQALVITGTTDSASGSININVTGGVQPYFSYLWSNGDTTQNVSGLSAGTYTVTVTDNAGCSTSKSFYIDSTVGINKKSAKASVIIYPNPTQGKFEVKAANFKIQSIEICNMLGERVFYLKTQQSDSNFAIDVSSQPNGIYSLKVKTDQGASNSMLIINK